MLEDKRYDFFSKVFNMARMYSRKKGKSGSTKPVKKGGYTWMNYKPKEAELLLIVTFSKLGLELSQKIPPPR